MRFSAATAAAAALLTTSTSAAVVPQADAASARVRRDSSGFTWDAEDFKVAAVLQPSVNFVYPLVQKGTWVNLDQKATIDQAIGIIEKAAAEGVKLIAFPELYFPGFPLPVGSNNYTLEQAKQYISQAMRFGDAEWTRLTSAIAAAKCTPSSAGLRSTATAPMPATLSSWLRHLLALTERLCTAIASFVLPARSGANLFSDGKISSIKNIELPFGNVTMLSCWENLWPVSRFVSAGLPATIHIGSFPYGAKEYEDSLY
ncbi:hypothetical protein JCM8547_005431 [Rhodosporidiobolus lusitaniae]